MLQDKTLPGCIKTKDFGSIKSRTFHYFSDASQSGYGQYSYIRYLNDRAQIHGCLLIRKSRLLPLKFISIPRLELLVSTLSVKNSEKLRKGLDVHVDDKTFWTDSQVVLGYINIDFCRFKVFVANGVQQIRYHTITKQWNFIQNNNNPADDASRGLDLKMKIQIKR